MLGQPIEIIRTGNCWTVKHGDRFAVQLAHCEMLALVVSLTSDCDEFHRLRQCLKTKGQIAAEVTYRHRRIKERRREAMPF